MLLFLALEADCRGAESRAAVSTCTWLSSAFFSPCIIIYTHAKIHTCTCFVLTHTGWALVKNSVRDCVHAEQTGVSKLN